MDDPLKTRLRTEDVIMTSKQEKEEYSPHTPYKEKENLLFTFFNYFFKLHSRACAREGGFEN